MGGICRREIERMGVGLGSWVARRGDLIDWGSCRVAYRPSIYAHRIFCVVWLPHIRSYDHFRLVEGIYVHTYSEGDAKSRR